MKETIYQYKSASRYLYDRMLEKQKTEPSFSVRKWAREMGYPSHSLLAMVLQGKRNLTLKQASYLARGLNLSTPEKHFFQGLIQLEGAKSEEEVEFCELFLSGLRPLDPESAEVLEVEKSGSRPSWLSSSLMALSETRDSFQNEGEAAGKLGSASNADEVRNALAELIQKGLLKRDGSGRYRSVYKRTSTKDNIADPTVSDFHLRCAQLTEKAVQTQSVGEREFQSTVIAIPSNRLRLAQEMLRKFRTTFCHAMGSANCDQVYQLNLHFFRITDSPLVQEANSRHVHQSVSGEHGAGNG